jgi:MFS superfamily sulfate permease-like transporter
LTIVLSTFLTGAFLYLVGRFRMGRWIRFIPYPVIGGFLAGTGWLLARGSFKVMCGIPLSLDSMGTLLEKGAILHWLPGGFFALAAGLPHVGSLMLVSAIVILLNAASVELATRKDVELDRELTSTGLANILSAPFGALAGCMALSRTILNYKAGATGRISGITCALICGVVLLAAARPWPSSPGRYWGDFCFIWACLFWRSGFGMDGSAYPGWIMGWSSA